MSDFSTLTKAGKAWVAAVTDLQRRETLEFAQALVRQHETTAHLAQAFRDLPMGRW
jgi:hypothetical protein